MREEIKCKQDYSMFVFYEVARKATEKNRAKNKMRTKTHSN